MKKNIFLCFCIVSLLSIVACNTDKNPETNLTAEQEFEKNTEVFIQMTDIPDITTEIEQNRQLHTLEEAILQEDAEAVHYFLEVKKTDPNQKTKDQEPMLVLAARRGFADAVKQLLNTGANINETDLQGHTALHSLAQEDYYWSDKVDYEAVLNMLLKANADVNAKDNQGITPLMIFSYTGDIDAVEKLLANGANVNAEDNNGKTALLIASERFPEIVQTLLINGANAHVKTNKKRMP